MTAFNFLGDLAKMAGGTMEAASQVKDAIKQEVKSRVDEMADRMDLVPRSEYQRLEAMVQEYRLQQSEMQKRLDALEKKSNSKK